MTNSKSFLPILLLVFFCINLSAQVNTTINLPSTEKINLLLKEYNVPAVGIGIIENGKITDIKVFGNRKENIPAKENTIFNIASMTKPIVAVVTLELVQTGKLNLDEPVYKYWIDPDITTDTMLKKLTIRHLLSHQSGFANWRTGKLKFEFEPGTKFQYSGEGFEYLRKVIEHKFNKSLSEISNAVLFKPLGMNDTYYVWNEKIKKNKFAFGHDSKGYIYKDQNWSSVNAAASIITTIKDFGKFMIYIMNGAGLSEKLYQDMLHPQLDINDHLARGLGWGLVYDLPNNEYALEHGGSNPGFQSMSIIFPKSKKGIWVFTNGDNGRFVYDSIIVNSLGDLGQKFMEITNKSYAAPEIKLSNEILDSYVGIYKRSDIEGYVLKVTREGKELKISGDAIPLMTLIPEAVNKFFIKGLPYQYEFITDESKKTIRLNLTEKQKLILFATRVK